MTLRSTLAIDVGNSRTKFGWFAPQTASTADEALPALVRSLVVSHDEAFPWRTLSAWAGDETRGAARVVAASVQPAVLARLLEDWPGDQWPLPCMLREAAQVPLEVRVEHPDRVGIDRLLNAVAANVLRPAATPAIVVSSGTATTVDFVSSDGAFEGGAIVPGLELSARSLHEHTALLPLIPVEKLAQPDLPVVGTSTTGAICSGVLYGQVGAVRELVLRMSRGTSTAPLVIVTGGGGPLLVQYLAEQVRLERDLTLQGLALVAQSL